MSPGPAGRLVVCPTPIGNLEDITLRAIATLRDADVIACEDTRTTGVLCDRHGIGTPRVRCDDHGERRAAPKLVARMEEGETVALVSDAGTPVVSDPGFLLVQAALAAGIPVEVLPGPSSVTTALVMSGLPADRWRFAGFLPRRKGELREVLRSPETLVAFESPRRLPGTLAVLAELDPDRPVAVCREISKLHEEAVRGTASELASRYEGSPPKGEVVLVVGASEDDGRDREGAAEAVARLIAAGARPRAAASVVSELTGVPANALYREAVTEDGSKGT
ncbi:MAG: 16S rRNA (cytidine(1402)-2'-O)-methyltransferase [Solirubrobacteraceae bacterium]|nr:16S rRNA (cytidine(1402)-2'-O)-methyltransferase [Solirubrobacteraceae bacterium]